MMNVTLDTAGVVISTYRKIRKISQKDLADMCGISASYLSQVEANQRKPSEGLFRELLNALDLELEVMYSVKPKSK